jgi:hypothetical protein
LVEDAFEKLPLHWMWWPALGAVAVGVTGYFAPHTMGVGYDNITGLLGGSFTVTMLLSLCLLKYLSWVISLGSGTSGGTLAPLFTIGGAFGALAATAALACCPGLPVNIPLAALVGMAAMFAGASRAVLTSIIFALETTAQPNALLPLLGACTAAYFISFFFSKGSIMTEKILRRGVRTPDVYQPDILQNINAEDLMMDAGTININTPATELKKLVGADSYFSRFKFFIAQDETGQFAGYIERLAFFDDVLGGDMPLSQAVLHSMPIAYTNQKVGDVCNLMGSEQMDIIAVVQQGSNKIAGVITAADIIAVYSDMHRRDNHYHTSISLQRRTMKLMARGRTMMRARKAGAR